MLVIKVVKMCTSTHILHIILIIFFELIFKKNISALGWNCSGDKLMVATGEHCHTQWCNHFNSLFVYSMSE